MAEERAEHTSCPVVVLSINVSRVQGDTIADRLRDELLAVLDTTGAQNVVLDLRQVTFVSSVAFRPLLSLHRRLKERGGRMVLCGLTAEVREVFEVTRLISTSRTSTAPFEVQADVPAAVASLYRTGT
jgi:anti-anti-sigma factor